MSIQLTDEDINRMREIRLHFWIDLVAIRAQEKLQKGYLNKFTGNTTAMHERKANICIKHIQALNVFFDVASHDTAENDYNKFISS